MKSLSRAVRALPAASAALLLTLAPAPASAADAAFATGPVFEAFGPVADVDADFEIPEGTVFKVVFDASEGAAPGELNPTLATMARFLNMHARAGVPVENMRLAVSVHGGALFDVTSAARYAQAKGAGAENANPALVAALLEKGVRIIVCGQSSARRDVEKSDLLPGVEVSLSAMTSQAVLQAEGYTLNPF